MDGHPELLYQEGFPLNVEAPRQLRARVASFAPMLGDTTGAIQQAISELVAALVRFGKGTKTFEFRFLSNDELFRFEITDSLAAQKLIAPTDNEGRIRLAFLDAVTERWGVPGNGKAVIWFEVLRTRATERRYATNGSQSETQNGDR